MGRKLRTLLLVLALPLGLLAIGPPGSEPPRGHPSEDASAQAPAPELAARPPSVMAGYDPQRAGHPLRIIAYALHPVGVVLDYALLRPAYWLGSHEPLRTLVGREH